ncbi:capsular biosynthesis protein [Neorhizobium sp. SOG26]|jgi:Capsule polysaccharide export protein|uniref:capsular polysaccharide export protein, LipB/KpsS family n=1 Tax=Neorhizobium sp. SOG26 TaxID=2060726 RepID=UPI000E58D77E|nr:capsular biosynthesis protein [Neorhizobium sp. SOG26]AXV15543.1 capsular biosynthesis protein [Neorhizobium sp. SOG26]
MDKDWLPQPGTRLGATFYVRRSQPWLSHYFGIDRLDATLAPGIGGVVLWGGRIPAKTARAIAKLRGLPSWYLEDGFLRSVGLGKENTLPISIQIDDLGMPVDASRPSRLEVLIAASAGMNFGGLGSEIRAALIREKLSKYNNLPHRSPKLEATTRRRVLLVDQVYGDVSVPMAGGSAASFERMLQDAVASDMQCVVRTHPDVMAGFRKGYLTEQARRTPGVVVTAEPVSVASMLEVIDEVWTVSSQMGLDALIRGTPVRCYAAPSYAGWGLTDDHFEGKSRVVARRRRARPSIDQLVAAAFSLYPCYRDTNGWREIDVFTAIETLAAERRQMNLD